MQHQPIPWNYAALAVTGASDPDRDERYRLMREREAQKPAPRRPILSLFRKAAA